MTPGLSSVFVYTWVFQVKGQKGGGSATSGIRQQPLGGVADPAMTSLRIGSPHVQQECQQPWFRTQNAVVPRREVNLHRNYCDVTWTTDATKAIHSPSLFFHINPKTSKFSFHCALSSVLLLSTLSSQYLLGKLNYRISRSKFGFQHAI